MSKAKRAGQRKARSRRSAPKRSAKRSTKRAGGGRRGKSARSARGGTSGKARAAKRSGARRRTAKPPVRRPAATRRRGAEEDRGETGSLARELAEYTATSPAASAGDVDADWQRSESSGEETVGGSVATPDQDVVDEIGRALGVEQPSQAPVRSAEEILEDRDRRYWELERRAQRKEERRRQP